MGYKKENIKIYHMTCTSCEGIVEKSIKKLPGIRFVKASFKKESAVVEYDEDQIDKESIKEAIKKAGYCTESDGNIKFIGIFIMALTVILLGLNSGGFDIEANLTNASYGVLFILGVFTSIHCVGMCGGIMLSQSIKIEGSKNSEALKPSLLYNLGRIISYTFLGGIIGAIGSVFSLSLEAKAALQIFASLFMLIMGFNMAGFKFFRSFNLRLPKGLCRKRSSSSPFVVGLLNGLMPCGPLQTMQLNALGTGSAIGGALSMFFFSIGTVPLMLTFGAAAGFLSRRYTKKLLQFSGVLIIILGIIMGSRGLALIGVDISPRAYISKISSKISGDTRSSNNKENVIKATMGDGYQVINMTANSSGYTPNAFYVQKGIPVKCIIQGERINSCNNAIVIPSLNKEQKLRSGETIIEFTPGDKDINFSCWMGMIRGVIKVTDNLEGVDTSNSDNLIPSEGEVPSCHISSDEEDFISPSIYGDDISKIATDILVNKTYSENNINRGKFLGLGYELKPLIIVSEKKDNTILTFDLDAFDYPQGNFTIKDGTTGETIASFKGENKIIDVEFNPEKNGAYGVFKDDVLLGILEVVENIEASDLEQIRETYIP